MSEYISNNFHRLRQALAVAKGASLRDTEIIDLLSGKLPLDRPTAAALASFDITAVIEIIKITGVEFSRINRVYAAAIAGEETPDELADHPKVVRRKSGPVWPAEKAFPLTPLEAWYIMRGWSVKPASTITDVTMLELSGKIEERDGWFKRWDA